MSKPRVPKEVLDKPEAVVAFTRSIAFMLAAVSGLSIITIAQSLFTWETTMREALGHLSESQKAEVIEALKPGDWMFDAELYTAGHVETYLLGSKNRPS